MRFVSLTINCAVGHLAAGSGQVVGALPHGHQSRLGALRVVETRRATTDDGIEGLLRVGRSSSTVGRSCRSTQLSAHIDQPVECALVASRQKARNILTCAAPHAWLLLHSGSCPAP